MMKDDIRYTHYVTPMVPLYAYFYYADNWDEYYNHGSAPKWNLKAEPVIAFGCWYEGEVNCSSALILEDSCLSPADDEPNFLTCSSDSNLTVNNFLDDIKQSEEIREAKRRSHDRRLRLGGAL